MVKLRVNVPGLFAAVVAVRVISLVKLISLTLVSAIAAINSAHVPTPVPAAHALIFGRTGSTTSASEAAAIGFSSSALVSTTGFSDVSATSKLN